MEKIKINRRFIILVIFIIMLFFIFLGLQFFTNKGPKSNFTPTPIKLTPVPNNILKPAEGSFNENNPQIWIGEDGNRIVGDN